MKAEMIGRPMEILLVEDEASILDMAQMILKEQGYTVLQAPFDGVVVSRNVEPGADQGRRAFGTVEIGFSAALGTRDSRLALKPTRRVLAQADFEFRQIGAALGTTLATY